MRQGKAILFVLHILLEGRIYTNNTGPPRGTDKSHNKGRKKTIVQLKYVNCSCNTFAYIKGVSNIFRAALSPVSTLQLFGRRVLRHYCQSIGAVVTLSSNMFKLSIQQRNTIILKCKSNRWHQLGVCLGNPRLTCILLTAPVFFFFFFVVVLCGLQGESEESES